MPRRVKCQECGEFNTSDKMKLHVHFTSSNRKKNMYFHEECYDQYLEKKKFNEKESEELYELTETIKKLHRLDINVPDTFFRDYIQPLRNGTFKSKKRIKKSKEGVPYSLMNDTYKYCEQTIDYVRTNKKFESTYSMLKYTFAVMIDKIQIVKKKNKQKIAEKEMSERHKESIIDDNRRNFQDTEISFKNKSNGRADISNFLD